MKPHPRIRKTVKWGGAVALVFLLAAWAASAWMFAGWSLASGYRAALFRDCIMLDWHDPILYPTRSGGFVKRADRYITWRLEVFREGVRAGVLVPIWSLVTPIALVTAAAWRLDTIARRRSRVGSCPKCGYDLRGLPTGEGGTPCPECGGGSSTSAHRAHTPDGGPSPQIPPRSEAPVSPGP